MATTFDAQPRMPDDLRFFRTTAIIMAVTIIAAFSLHYLAGRSSLSARPLVHAHGLAFMAWVVIFTTQAWLGASGSIKLHRRLGLVAALWVPLLVVMGTWLTVDGVQRGTSPFIFQPQYFLIANPLGVLVFALLVGAAIAARRRIDWHVRLHICAMASILGPAFGRLLPMPLLIPWAFEISTLCGLLFPLAGIIRDVRCGRGIHRAWLIGIGAILGALAVSQLLASSPAGDILYGWVTAGHPGTAVPGMAYPPPPSGL